MKYLYVLLLTLTVNACSGQRNQKTEESNVAPPTFEMVSVPTPVSYTHLTLPTNSRV